VQVQPGGAGRRATVQDAVLSCREVTVLYSTMDTLSALYCVQMRFGVLQGGNYGVSQVPEARPSSGQQPQGRSSQSGPSLCTSSRPPRLGVPLPGGALSRARRGRCRGAPRRSPSTVR